MADALPFLFPIPGSTGLRMEHLVLMVVVPIALVVLTMAFVIAHLATPVGECSEGVVLGQLVVHRWDEPCRGDRNCPQTGPANRPRG